MLVNAVWSSGGGGTTLIVEQLKALARIEDLDVTVYATPPVAERLGSVSQALAVRELPARPLLLRLLWEQLVLPLKAFRHDVVYMPGNFALMLSPRPQVVTLQKSLHFGSEARMWRSRLFSFGGRVRLRFESVVARLSVRRADVVVAVSRTLADSVAEDMGEPHRPDVVLSTAAHPDADTQPIPGRKPARPDYVLAVADDYPHKRWEELIAAFSEDANLPPLKLVGAPRNAARLEELRRLVATARSTVALIGPVHGRDLELLYAGAACCVAHSFTESFGFTALEALVRELPVAASDIPAHREVCGDAVWFYPPDQPGALRRAVRRAIQSGPPEELPDICTRTWNQNARELKAVMVRARRGSDA